MQIKKRSTAWVVAGALIFWNIIGQPIWNLNVERFAEQQKLDSALANGGVMTWLSWFASYVPSSFGLGFAAGALIFAHWDAIVRWLPLVKQSEVVEPSRRAVDFWIGSTDAFTENIQTSPNFYINANMISVGRETCSLEGLDGIIVIRIIGKDGKDMSFNVHDAMVEGISNFRKIERFWEIFVSIALPLSATVRAEMFAAMEDDRLVTFDLRSFGLSFASLESEARLKLPVAEEFDFRYGHGLLSWPRKRNNVTGGSSPLQWLQDTGPTTPP